MGWEGCKEFPENDKPWFIVSLLFVFRFQEKRQLLFSLNYGSIHSLLSQILTVRTGLIPIPHSLGMRLVCMKFEQNCSFSVDEIDSANYLVFLHVAASSHQTT